jgi:hypothetical protein
MAREYCFIGCPVADGDEVYGAVEEVRAWVLAHIIGRPTRGSAGTTNVPVPHSNIILLKSVSYLSHPNNSTI